LFRDSFTLYDYLGNHYDVADSAPGRPLTDPNRYAANNFGLKVYSEALLPTLTLKTVLVFDVIPNALDYLISTWNSGSRRIRLYPSHC
jgi:hypothetical protein